MNKDLELIFKTELSNILKSLYHFEKLNYSTRKIDEEIDPLLKEFMYRWKIKNLRWTSGKKGNDILILGLEYEFLNNEEYETIKSDEIGLEKKII